MGRKLRSIGYWRSKEQPYWPDPGYFIDTKWCGETKEQVIRHLESGKSFCASAPEWCRFRCAAQCLDNVLYTDGVYIWPIGLVHYLQEHSIRLPQEFVAHVLNWGSRHIGEIDIEWLIGHVDDEWWKSQKGHSEEKALESFETRGE